MATNLLTSLLGGTALLGFLILVHEGGHYAVARLLGVRVLCFSIGFGPRLFGWTRGGTEYRVSAIPLGGYVRMMGEDPTAEVPDEEKRSSFAHQAPWRRAAIAFAGPFVNLLTAAVLLWLVAALPQTVDRARVGRAEAGSPAAAAGIRAGDLVVAVNGRPTASVVDLRDALAGTAGIPTPVRIDRQGMLIDMTVTPLGQPDGEKRGRLGVLLGTLPARVSTSGRARASGLQGFETISAWDGRPITSWAELEPLLVESRAQPRSTPLRLSVVRGASTVDVEIPAGEGPLGIDEASLVAAVVEDGTPAFSLGLRVGDRLTAIDGQPVASRLQIGERLNSGRPVGSLEVQRDGQTVTLPVPTPLLRADGSPARGPLDGMRLDSESLRPLPTPPADQVTVRLGLVDAATDGFQSAWRLGGMLISGVRDLVVGRVSAKMVGGPVMMYQLAGEATRSGLIDFLTLMAVLSINLGLMNLLPIPVLDGFHILSSAIEGILRRPVPVRFRVVTNVVGLTLLLGLTGLALRNDLGRLLGFESFALPGASRSGAP